MGLLNLWHLFTTSRNSDKSLARLANDALPSLLTYCFFTLLISSLIKTDFVGFPELLCKTDFMSLFGVKHEIVFFEYSTVKGLADGPVAPKTFKAK